MANNNLFDRANLRPISKQVAEDLTHKTNEIKQQLTLNFEKKQDKPRKVQLSLSVYPDKILKLKQVAKQYDLSVSALLEQIIDQL
ncbi:hypothetical protein GL982_10715 (plasmid) [Spiroplasma citri]|uniref:Uncharacterized protein n=1 Tax=Spiroplasma citri TaxID=2133 RepID=Q3ZVF9_SPICI|nr:hypothetical protein [Spiroplasma citri]QED25637.1 hypothetical protein FRX96_10175 [Spiroplasma citri]QIA69902.1 hypothetical protein GL298_10775 [Spiroplasma citri]QIA71804.1 hypothetical protein GL981_10930 [Spiroplasma citri]QIA71881.1 hypothetical protein GL981_11320 [Spiroplasma citri]QIA74013.1 hypothetical protein GL982_10715 [Spiroplasma citri]